MKTSRKDSLIFYLHKSERQTERRHRPGVRPPAFDQAPPGVMMMLRALVIISTVWSTFTSVCVPVISIGLPVPVEEVPNPPRITFGRDRFIACRRVRSTLTGGRDRDVFSERSKLDLKRVRFKNEAHINTERQLCQFYLAFATHFQRLRS